MLELDNVAAQQFLTVTEPGGEPRLAATRENGQVQLQLTPLRLVGGGARKGPSSSPRPSGGMKWDEAA